MDTEAVIFNPFDPVWRADPYPFYRQLREQAPIGQVPGLEIWYLSRYDDCLAILRDRRGGVDTRKSPVYEALAEMAGLRLPEDIEEQRSFLFLDPPDHTRLRGLVAAAFTPRVVEGMRQRIQELVDGLLESVDQRGRLDVVADLGYPLALTVISELLGIPPSDHARFTRWSKELAASMDPQLGAPPEVIERQIAAMREARDYLEELIGERRRHPGDDLLSALIDLEHEGDRLTEGELLSTVVLLFAAGHETTVNMLSNTMLALLTHPDQLAGLRADPQLAGAAIEEALRWDAPTQITQRIALEDLTIDGHEIAKGAPIVVLLAAANRDDTRIPDAERFDVARPPVRNLSFGFGPHFCLGAALARLEGEVVLKTLIGRFGDMRMDADGVRRRDTFVLRGLEALPVEVGAGGA
jgi:cytochrome P450